MHWGVLAHCEQTAQALSLSAFNRVAFAETYRC